MKTTQNSVMSEQIYRIDGMDCADCARGLEKVMNNLESVEKATVNYGAGKMKVRYSGYEQEIVRAVRNAGYVARIEESVGTAQSARPFWFTSKVWTTLMSGIFLSLGILFQAVFHLPEWVIIAAFLSSILVGGVKIAWSGLYNLKNRLIGINFLMTIAVLGAIVIGEWFEGAAVVFLFSLGETLEAYTMERTRRSLRTLLDLAPKEALIRREGIEQWVDIKLIQVGDVMITKPGEKIAMDGVVISGLSSVNQAPITGESIPVDKTVGDQVFAGTLNEYHVLEIEVTHLASENTLAKIVHLIEEAQEQKAPSQRFVDLFSSYYTPAVIVLAIGVAVIPVLFGWQSFEYSFYQALMLLVVSCPCALVISTPVSIVSAIGNAAKQGVLIKGGAYLEQLGQVDTVAFDKTGTLTKGTPKVIDVRTFTEMIEDEVISLLASIEYYSEHPIGKTIVQYAQDQEISLQPCIDFQAFTGEGVAGECGGTTYYIGKPSWIQQRIGAFDDQVDSLVNQFTTEGKTMLMISTSNQLIGLMALADTIRDESVEVLTELKKLGLKRLMMLTGDHKGTAHAISGQLGGIEVKADLLPADKVAWIKDLQLASNGVAMVGDGMNDAPALATAKVGIAMGGAGNDTAMETADMTLMGDDLSKLPFLMKLSRKTLKIIKQNILFSLLVKAIFLVLIFTGHSTLWLAVLADTGSSLLVIFNGMRLLRKV